MDRTVLLVQDLSVRIFKGVLRGHTVNKNMPRQNYAQYTLLELLVSEAKV